MLHSLTFPLIFKFQLYEASEKVLELLYGHIILLTGKQAIYFKRAVY